MTALSWSSLVEHLQTRYSPYRPIVGGGVFTCTAPDAPTIEVGVGVSAATSWFAIATTLCPVRMLRPRCAMIAMTDLPMGAFAIVGDVAMFRHSFPSSSAASFDTTVAVFVEIARELIDAQGFVEVEDPTAALEPNDARFAYLYW